jgi:hypothetical protein
MKIKNTVSYNGYLLCVEEHNFLNKYYYNLMFIAHTLADILNYFFASVEKKCKCRRCIVHHVIS